MNIEIGNCPFGPDDDNFSVLPLSVLQKRWLGSQIVLKIQRVADLSDRYKIDRKHLYYIAAKVRKGKPIFDGAGRPKLFDTESIEALRLFVETPPPPSFLQLGFKCMDECRKTKLRRHVEADDVTVSRRSIRRYETVITQ